jgi:hypothetical protein
MPFVKGAPKPPGSGCRKGSHNKMGRDVSELAQMHTPGAIDTLVAIMKDDQAPRVMAANALLDRGHGKVPQAITAEAPPPVVNLEVVRERILEKLERAAAFDNSAKGSSMASRIGRLLIDGTAIRHDLPGNGNADGSGPAGGAS